MHLAGEQGFEFLLRVTGISTAATTATVASAVMSAVSATLTGADRSILVQMPGTVVGIHGLVVEAAMPGSARLARLLADIAQSTAHRTG